MSVYATDFAEVDCLVGSGDADLERRLSEERDEPMSKEERWAVGALVRGDYPKEKVHDQAHDMIRAFEHLCRSVSKASITVEMYDDPDETPPLWDFLWVGTDGENPLRLPFSRAGTPAVTWHSPERTADSRAAFERWRGSGNVNERFMPLDELDGLVVFLGEAVEGGHSVFVFYEGG